MKLNISITKEIDYNAIADLLNGALEGGSNYWYMIEEKIEPSNWFIEEVPVFSTKEEAEKYSKHYLHYYPLNPGGALKFTSTEEENSPIYTLDIYAIEKGLKLMAENHPKHFADFLNDNYDGDTSDIFLQLALFGEVIYG